MIRLLIGKTLFACLLLAVATTVALALFAARNVPVAAERYHHCYLRSLRSFDFSFDACRVETQNIKDDFRAQMP